MISKNLKIARVLSIVAALFVLLSLPLVSSACGTTPPTPPTCGSAGDKPGNSAPTISISGDNPLHLDIGASFSSIFYGKDYVTATDSEDGDLSREVFVVFDNVDTSVAGSYTVTYIVADRHAATACADLQVIVDAAPIPAPTVDLTTDRDSIDEGESVDLSWTSTDADSCSADWTSLTTTSGVQTVSPSATGSYSITCTGSGGQASDTVSITVASGPVDPKEPALSLTAVPLSINKGQSSIISWDAENVDSCSATWTSSTDVSGSETVSPESTADYSMTCTGSNGDVSKSVTVTVSGGGGPVNTPPVITLVGSNPFDLLLGSAFTDPLATATDAEDGDLTTAIVVTGSVDPAALGSYTLTYTVTDSGGLSASVSREVVVKEDTPTPPQPPVNPPSGGGGGGYSGGHRRDISHLLGPQAPQGEVLGAASCVYLFDHLKMGQPNDSIEVLKLQSFLNVYEGENLPLTGHFGPETFAAVQRFQVKYSEDILEPWGDKVTTGYVYILTKKKINEIFCNSQIPLTLAQEQEISDFRNMPASTISAGGGSGSLPGDKEGGPLTDEGTGLSDKEGGWGWMSDRVSKNAAVSLLALPQKVFGNWKYLTMFLILLAILVVAVKSLFGSKGYPEDDDTTPGAGGSGRDNSGNSTEPIILPEAKGKSVQKSETVIFPDEEIVIENSEEEELTQI